MSEVRLIDANALADVLQKRSDELMDEGKCIMSGTAMGAVCFVLSAPTITPESLGWRKEVYGDWGEYLVELLAPSLNGYRCSVCGVRERDGWRFSFCPSCGADMRGERQPI